MFPNAKWLSLPTPNEIDYKRTCVAWTASFLHSLLFPF